jgi:uncharacterized protein (TIGR02996 family)
MRTFVFTDGKSNKFWNIERQGARTLVTFGRVGSKGQTQLKDFPDEAAARNAHDKFIAEKLAKGYVETTPRPAAPLQQSLEAALVDDPDDLAAHSAYADYLMEQGDPRGELTQVQLALEGAGRPEKERERLRRREGELLEKHARRWLGDVGRFLVGDWSGEDKPWHFRFARGWLDAVRLLPFPEAVVIALARAPEARLLRRLEVVYDMRHHPFGFDNFILGPNRALKEEERVDRGDFYMSEPGEIMPPLLASPHLRNLRAFKLGFSDSGERMGYSTMVAPFANCNARQVIELLRKCPRLEELTLNAPLPRINELFAAPELSQVRSLQYYYGDGERYGAGGSRGYRLSALAKNAAAGRLTTLRLHAGRETTISLKELNAVLRSPHLPSLTHLQVRVTTFGDEGALAVVKSGILRRLEVLDLGHGNMTDEGARLLAECPDLGHLERLHVSRNALTKRGVAALRARGIEVVADDQHRPDEEDYLYDVDFE